MRALIVVAAIVLAVGVVGAVAYRRRKAMPESGNVRAPAGAADPLVRVPVLAVNGRSGREQVYNPSTRVTSWRLHAGAAPAFVDMPLSRIAAAPGISEVQIRADGYIQARQVASKRGFDRVGKIIIRRDYHGSWYDAPVGTTDKIEVAAGTDVGRIVGAVVIAAAATTATVFGGPEAGAAAAAGAGLLWSAGNGH